MSARRSTANPAWNLLTLAQYRVSSLSVLAFSMPPTRSIVSEMISALGRRFGSFEEHMLDEMRASCFRVRLKTRTDGHA